jgi:flagellar protein FlbD
MIKLTRLDGEVFLLNADLISYVEARPDTFITLTTGERMVVAESMDEVLRRAVAYQQAKHLMPPPAPPGRLGENPPATGGHGRPGH